MGDKESIEVKALPLGPISGGGRERDDATGAQAAFPLGSSSLMQWRITGLWDLDKIY